MPAGPYCVFLLFVMEDRPTVTGATIMAVEIDPESKATRMDMLVLCTYTQLFSAIY